MKGEGREQGIPWNDKIDKIDKIDTLPTCKGTMLDESKLVSNLSFESDYDRNAARSIETRCKISLFILLNSPSIKKKREKIRNFAGKDRNGALCVFRKRGGAANTGPARVTELHLTQFPAYIAIISSRGETARFRSKPANDDRGICVLLYILIVLSLFANRRPEQRRWNYSYFFEDRSREFIPLFFLFLSSPFLSPRFKSFSFVSNRRRGKSFFRRSVFLSIILLVLSFPSFVDNLVRGTFFFLFSLLHGKISELRLDFTLMERDIGGIREKKINAKTLTITFRGRETFWKF